MAAADQNLMDYLSGPAMTELVTAELIKAGMPKFYPAGFDKVSSNKPVGIIAMYEAYNGVRNGGRFTNYDGPPVSVEVTGSQKQFITALGGREEITVPSELVLGLKSNIPFVAGNAMNEYLRRIRNFTTRAVSRRTNMVASVATTGALYVSPNVNGITQGNAMGNVITNSAGINAANRLSGYTPLNIAQSAALPNSTVTVPDFANAATDIPGFFRALRVAYIKTTGYLPKLIQYGQNIPSYLGSVNTSMQAYWSRNQTYGKAYQDTNEVPAGALDFTWHPSYLQYYMDETTGTTTPTQWLTADKIVITPDIDEGWYEYTEGSCIIPKGIPTLVNSSADLMTMLDQLEYRWGINGFSYMHPTTFQIATVVQDYSIPIPKNGNLQWIITTH